MITNYIFIKNSRDILSVIPILCLKVLKKTKKHLVMIIGLRSELQTWDGPNVNQEL
jgi:hypothetical protein